jgi:alpha-L-fucosidase
MNNMIKAVALQVVMLLVVPSLQIEAQSKEASGVLYIGRHVINIEVKEKSAVFYPDSLWLKSRFSMFIHWGLYSQLGGVWEGKPVTRGYSEQIQSFAGIFSDYYEDLMKEFRAEKWNADSIVVLAKRAGMKSIVFTSKHHDGFCMYNSAQTDFTVMHTPFGRDPLKELAEACKKEGLRLGVYFSLIDWHFPEAYPISSHNADPVTPEHHKYNMAQVRELLTNYGAVSEFWFDMGSLTTEQSAQLAALVRSLQPKCMISGRLGNGCGDFAVMPDNKIPDYHLAQPWQTAASMFKETWGYRSWQERGSVEEKIQEKLRDLRAVVSQGGNYLLNIGPRGDGSVVEFERDVLLGMGKTGKWLSENPFVLNNPAPSYRKIDSPRSDSSFRAISFDPSDRMQLTISSGKKILYRGTLQECSFNCYGKTVHVTLSEGEIILQSAGARRDRIVLTKENGAPIYIYSSKNYYDSYMKVCGLRWGL